MARLSEWLGRLLGRYLNQTTWLASLSPATAPAVLRSTLQPGDVLLVEGRTRISTAIKYLTQSTWSHSAVYVGPSAAAAASGVAPDQENPLCFVEADMMAGVRLVGLGTYDGLHTRICRAVSLTASERERVVAHVLARVGHQYDMKNVTDLARYLVPTPPVPARWRRRLLALGSGDPTRAICSTLIAQAFDEVRYPILPLVEWLDTSGAVRDAQWREILHVRHHSLYVPRDFDVSPYFAVVKPTLAAGFDHRRLLWSDAPETASHTEPARTGLGLGSAQGCGS